MDVTLSDRNGQIEKHDGVALCLILRGPEAESAVYFNKNANRSVIKQHLLNLRFFIDETLSERFAND